MLSYRHAYHAGNYADVLKHLVLVRILDYLTQKKGAVKYLDTHAGAGAYNLQTDLANKTAEYRQGISRIWASSDLPPALNQYRALVQQFNSHDELKCYPGSPWFARQILRSQDRLALCELHPQDFPVLAELFKGDRRSRCYQDDGFAKSMALVPPSEKRGLVLIDPSYELKEDYGKVVSHIKALHRRFATGVYALWYPVVDEKRIRQLERDFISSGLRRIDLYELRVASDSRKGMSASGMIVVNPPWILQNEMRESLSYLASALHGSVDSGEDASYRIKTLVGE